MLQIKDVYWSDSCLRRVVRHVDMVWGGFLGWRVATCQVAHGRVAGSLQVGAILVPAVCQLSMQVSLLVSPTNTTIAALAVALLLGGVANGVVPNMWTLEASHPLLWIDFISYTRCVWGMTGLCLGSCGATAMWRVHGISIALD